MFLWGRADLNSLKNYVDTEITKFIANNDINAPIKQLWSDNNLLSPPWSLYLPRWRHQGTLNPGLMLNANVYPEGKNVPTNGSREPIVKRTGINSRSWHVNLGKPASLPTITMFKNMLIIGETNNPKKLFSFIKSWKCENDGVAPLRDKGKIHIDD